MSVSDSDTSEIDIDIKKRVDEKIISQIKKLFLSSTTKKMPVSKCVLIPSGELMPTGAYNDFIQHFREHGSWDSRKPCVVIGRRDESEYFVVGNDLYMSAAKNCKIKHAYAYVFKMAYEDVSENDLSIIRTYLSLSTPNRTSEQPGIIQQISEMNVLLERHYSNPTFTPQNPRKGLNKKELVRLIPRKLVEDNNRHFLLKFNDKYNRGALRLIYYGVVPRLLKLEKENPNCLFSLDLLRVFSLPGCKKVLILEQVQEWEDSDRKKTAKWEITVDALVSIGYPNRKCGSRGQSSGTVKHGTNGRESSRVGEVDSSGVRSHPNSTGSDSKADTVKRNTSENVTKEHIRPFQYMYETAEGATNVLTESDFQRVMSDGQFLSDGFIYFAAGEITLRGGTDVYFVETFVTLSKNFRRSFSPQVFQMNPDTIAFGITEKNHHSLVCAFGVRDAFDWIATGYTSSNGDHCPVRIVHFDSCPSAGHFEIVQSRISAWLEKYFIQAWENEGLHRDQIAKGVLPRDTNGDFDEVHNSPEQQRLWTALQLYVVEDMPQQTDSFSCGWHVLRVLWLVVDKHLTKNHLFNSKFSFKRLEYKTRARPDGYALRSIEKNRSISKAFEAISIGQTKLRLRACLLVLHPQRSRLPKDMEVIAAWMSLSRKLERKAQKNHRLFQEVSSASKDWSAKRSIQLCNCFELTPLRKSPRREASSSPPRSLSLELPTPSSLPDTVQPADVPILQHCETTLRTIRHFGTRMKDMYNKGDVKQFMSSVKHLEGSIVSMISAYEEQGSPSKSKGVERASTASQSFHKSPKEEPLNDSQHIAVELVQELIHSVEKSVSQA